MGLYIILKGEKMEKEKSNKKISALILAGLGVVLCVFAIISLSKPSGQMTLNNSNMTCEYDALLEGWYVEISGTIKNDTGSDYRYVQVSFSLYDANGINLGTAFDNMNNLGAGETWSFNAQSLEWYDTKVTSYKLAEITYW